MTTYLQDAIERATRLFEYADSLPGRGSVTGVERDQGIVDLASQLLRSSGDYSRRYEQMPGDDPDRGETIRKKSLHRLASLNETLRTVLSLENRPTDQRLILAESIIIEMSASVKRGLDTKRQKQ